MGDQNYFPYGFLLSCKKPYSFPLTWKPRALRKPMPKTICEIFKEWDEQVRWKMMVEIVVNATQTQQDYS